MTSGAPNGLQEDGTDTVPSSYREGSGAVGATYRFRVNSTLPPRGRSARSQASESSVTSA